MRRNPRFQEQVIIYKQGGPSAYEKLLRDKYEATQNHYHIRPKPPYLKHGIQLADNRTLALHRHIGAWLLKRMRRGTGAFEFDLASNSRRFTLDLLLFSLQVDGVGHFHRGVRCGISVQAERCTVSNDLCRTKTYVLLYCSSKQEQMAQMV